MFPDSCPETLSLLQATTLPPPPAITGSLLNELNEIAHPFLLILDDYHTIHETSIHQLLAELLRYPPAGMRLVLASRRNPLLPLTRLRAKSLMTEIRMQDLRFTMEEATTLLQQMVETQIDEATVSLLQEKTEGWVTGLRLIVLSHRHRGNLDNLLVGLRRINRYVMDYLISEVLSFQPPDVQAFLVKSSILDRLCGSLCDTVVGLEGGNSRGQDYLDNITKADLFVIPLDDQQQWFRYHHLFQQFLQQRLRQQGSAEEVALLHTRASEWFAREGFIEEALSHILAAKDNSRAIRLVAQHRHALMIKDEWQRLARWLGLFPRETIDMEPELLVLEAWIKRVSWKLSELPAILQRIETLLAHSPPSKYPEIQYIQAELDTIQAFVLLISIEIEPALTCLKRALSILSSERLYVYGDATMLMGFAYRVAGDLSSAEAFISKKVKEGPDDIAFKTRLVSMLSIVYWMEADLDKMWLMANRYSKLNQKAPNILRRSWGRYLEGFVHYHRNNLLEAEQAFEAAVQHPYQIHLMALVHGRIGLAMTYQAQGRLQKARALAEETITFLVETDNTFLLAVAQAFQAELALRQGHLTEASQWASQTALTPPKQGMSGFYGPQLALPKILLAQNTNQSLQEAADYLADLHHFVKAVHNTRFLIEVLALKALLYEARQNRPAALEVLEQAINLAQPGGFIRLFVDLGPKLKPLLADLAHRSIASAYIAQILTAFEHSDSPELVQNEALIDHLPQPTLARRSPDLIETLTNREMDVLLLLADRLTNKEIAQELGISTETVKAHANNLYRKLHINNRRQAVAQARALGLLPSD